MGNAFATANVLALLHNGDDTMFFGNDRIELLIEAKQIYEEFFDVTIDLEQFYSGWVFIESYKSTTPMTAYTTDTERLVSNGTTSENHSISTPTGTPYFNYSLYKRTASPRIELYEQYSPIADDAFPIVFKTGN